MVDLPEGPEPLSSHHKVELFDCGHPALNTFLHKHALANQKGGASRTYIIHEQGQVTGFYSLAPASVELADAPDRIRKGQAQHAIPVILLARLAVDQSRQGQGLGKFLLLDAFRRAVAGADVIGGRALLIHAKDEEARSFYLKYDAEPSPTDHLHLLILMKDLRNALGHP